MKILILYQVRLQLFSRKPFLWISVSPKQWYRWAVRDLILSRGYGVAAGRRKHSYNRSPGWACFIRVSKSFAWVWERNRMGLPAIEIHKVVTNVILAKVLSFFSWTRIDDRVMSRWKNLLILASFLFLFPLLWSTWRWSRWQKWQPEIKVACGIPDNSLASFKFPSCQVMLNSSGVIRLRSKNPCVS